MDSVKLDGSAPDCAISFSSWSHRLKRQARTEPSSRVLYITVSGRTPLATICSKTLRAPSRSPSLQCPFTKDEYVIVLGSMPSSLISCRRACAFSIFPARACASIRVEYATRFIFNPSARSWLYMSSARSASPCAAKPLIRLEKMIVFGGTSSRHWSKRVTASSTWPALTMLSSMQLSATSEGTRPLCALSVISCQMDQHFFVCFRHA
mmetsp:Transcript_26340/g.62797  ORF Transcript_26340/g.62797 Transcript_26340/m.62797 type:complete len:208 (-) Transcript_26340:2181-2804(-)